MKIQSNIQIESAGTKATYVNKWLNTNYNLVSVRTCSSNCIVAAAAAAAAAARRIFTGGSVGDH